MTELERATLGALFALALTSCGGGGPPADPAALGTTSRVSINSAEAGFAYDVDVWLPAGYAGATTTYPVVYAMDCEYRFATLTQVLQQSATKLILVNVCAMGSARRWIDFTMPGAAAYYRFLVNELVPFVDANFRTSPANRTLAGHSLSGEFVLYALYMESPSKRHFTSFVSEECSCWYDASMAFSEQLAQPMAMEQAMYDADHRLPVNLVMAGDNLSNEAHVAAAYAAISSRHYEGLRASQPVYSLGHVSMDGPAFKDAIDFIFNVH